MNLANNIINSMKRRKWIVTYDNVDEIRNMYAKVATIEFQLQYSLEVKRVASEVMFFSKKLNRPINENELLNII